MNEFPHPTGPMGNVDAGLVKSLRPLRAPAARRTDGRPWHDQRNEQRHSNLLLTDSPLPHGLLAAETSGRPNLIPSG
jgi:hypothetical protein